MRRFASISVPWMLLLAGCASTYDSNYRFQPRPASIETVHTEGSGPLARTLVSVTGVRRGTSEAGPAIELRMRVENVSGTDLELDPHSLELVSADVQTFGPPLIEPPSLIIPAEGVTTFDVLFPIPESAFDQPIDLSSINLRWSLFHDGRVLTHEATFDRTHWRFVRVYGPPWFCHGPFYHHHFHHHPGFGHGWSGGVVVVHGW